MDAKQERKLVKDSMIGLVADQVEWQIEQLTSLFNARLVELETVIAELDDLESHRCTGNLYWRDEKGRTPRLYANHGRGVGCPAHGEPLDDDHRIRKYIGSDPAKQAQAEQLIANAARYEELENRVRHLRRMLERAMSVLGGVYGALRFRVPSTGESPSSYE